MEMKALREMAQAKRIFVWSANRSRSTPSSAPGLLIVIHFGTVCVSLPAESVEHGSTLTIRRFLRQTKHTFKLLATRLVARAHAI